MHRYLGIDPGLSGAAAILEILPGQRPRLLALVDIPLHGEGAKRRVDAGRFFRWIKANFPDFAFVERGQAMPDQGASAGYSYGRAVGALEACVACAAIPLGIVEPSVWKRAAGLPGGKANKEASRQRAIQMFPESDEFEQKVRGRQRAEAVLIAKHGAENLAGGVAAPRKQAAGSLGSEIRPPGARKSKRATDGGILPDAWG